MENPCLRLPSEALTVQAAMVAPEDSPSFLPPFSVHGFSRMDLAGFPFPWAESQQRGISQIAMFLVPIFSKFTVIWKWIHP